MTLADGISIAVGIIVIGGGIVGIVRWLDKGKVQSQVDSLKEKNEELGKRLSEIQLELKANSINDQSLKDRVLKIEASHDGINTSINELKDMVKTMINKFDQKQSDVNLLTQRIAVLEDRHGN